MINWGCASARHTRISIGSAVSAGLADLSNTEGQRHTARPRCTACVKIGRKRCEMLYTFVRRIAIEKPRTERKYFGATSIVD